MSQFLLKKVKMFKISFKLRKRKSMRIEKEINFKPNKK